MGGGTFRITMNRATTNTPLKRVLTEEGRKQSWLADRAGIDPTTLSRIVNGLHADDATREKIAAALGREIGELWPEERAA